MTRRRRSLAFGLLATAFFGAAVAALVLGSVRLTLAQTVAALFDPAHADPAAVRVVWTVRVPRTAAAALVGAALGVCGAQMQTVFRNPLADPFVLGVSSGASFGVAVVVLGAGGTGAATWLGGLGALGGVGVVGGAFAGATVTILVSLAFAQRVEGTATVLIVGLMFGYVVSAFVSILVAAADPGRLQQFSLWGQGSFRGITLRELGIMAPVVAVGLALALSSAKALNALLLGQRYAASMGVAVRASRAVILLTSSLLAAVATCYAGPIGFIGVAAPHLARPLIDTSDHRALLPATVLLGATIALVAEVVAQLPGQAGVLPLNAVTAVIGAPVVVWVLTSRRHTEVGA